MQFISCDWGTSSFRLRLIDQASAIVLAEVKSPQGIAATHELWRQSAEPAADDRIPFYLSFLSAQIGLLASRISISIDDLPLIISGMASSSIGIIELPYKDCPFSTNGHDLGRHQIPATSAFPHPVTLISGVRTANDVMRGEETLLVGAMDETREGIFIFPGTHSKHVRVHEGFAIDLKTYMTGEFFGLLSQKSILSGSISLSDKSDSVTDFHTDAFTKGLETSLTGNILHNTFLVRTHHLFGTMSKQDNAHFLSGLLIGAELRELSPSPDFLTLVSSGRLRTSYELALHTLGFTGVTTIDADQALIAAHCKMLL